MTTFLRTTAGFSKDAGLPLTSELVRRSRERLKNELGRTLVDAIMEILDEVAYKVLQEPVGEEIEAIITRLKVLELYSAEYTHTC